MNVGNVSPSRTVPAHIQKPVYHNTGIPEDGPELPEIKSKEQIEKMRASCRLAADILKRVGNAVEVDIVSCIICNVFIVVQFR